MFWMFPFRFRRDPIKGEEGCALWLLGIFVILFCVIVFMVLHYIYLPS